MSIWALQSENAKMEFKMLRFISGNAMKEKGERKEEWGELQIVM